MKKSAWTVLAAVALAVQLAALGGLAFRWERVARKGVEVRLACGAFDPRDLLRGRYLHVDAGQEYGDVALDIPRSDWTWDYLWERRHRLWVRLEEGEDGLRRVAKVAERPLDDGLWVRPSLVTIPHGWAEENGGVPSQRPARAEFPGKLFLDERLAPTADRLFAGRSGATGSVAVYRALGGAMVLVDVELGGESIRDLARRAREEAAAAGPEED